MNYDEAMTFIRDTEKYGSVQGLDNMFNLMDELENVQDKLKILHIAGTNGKGSVGSFIGEVLKVAGFKVGRYISPTIFEYNERFQINNKFIAESKFCYICGKVKKAIEKIVSEGKCHPTSFEVETAIAFLYFYEEKCDFVLLETGLGGRLDATNIIKKNLCSVITSISIDHINFLGSSLSEIAVEKCGIIKNDSFTVSIFQDREVMNVIEKSCIEKKSKLIKVLKEDILYNGVQDYCQSFDYKNYLNVKIGLLGKFQVENASLAIEVIELLMRKGYNITKKNIYDGLFNAIWQGRFQVIGENPVFVVDGAHNADAAKRLRENIQIYFANKKIVFIVGVFKDKDYKKIAEITADLADEIFVFTLKSPRGLDAKIFCKEFLKYNKNVFYVSGVREAVSKSILAAGEEGAVIAFGSLSYMGEIIKIYGENKEVFMNEQAKEII